MEMRTLRPFGRVVLALLLILLFGDRVNAVTLTYKMQPNEKTCFYANSIKPDEKIAFYYAVRAARARDLDAKLTYISPDSSAFNFNRLLGTIRRLLRFGL